MSEPTRLGGRFQLISLAGKGGSGEVYRALDEATGRTVAVKWALRPHHLLSDPTEERFTRERRLLETISSPHVVRLVGHGVSDDGRSFIAVDWLDGMDLSRRQKERPLRGRSVVELLHQVADGLDAIHRVGSIHRDVKPANVFVDDTPDGRLRATVIDLGIAQRRGEPSLTHRGHIVGTPWYMSPEQILRSDRVGAASDQFSLGVLAFELLAGVRPYQGDDMLAVVAKIALTDPPRLSDVAPDVPPDVDAIVARAMSKDPEARFASVTEFAEALARATPFEPIPPLPAASAAEVRDTEVVSSRGSNTAGSGERRVVTAVFARFSSSDESRAAQAAFDRAVRPRGGEPHALLSIALVAIFGADRSTGDEPLRATTAALALSREMPHADVVVATGRTVGGLGELPVEAVERAARPRSADGAADRATRRVRIDPATARLLGDAFEIQRVGPDLEIFGERRPHGWPRTFLGITSKCIGRDREVAELEALYAESAGESVARVAIVTAPPGMGKSRLRQELLSKLGARDDAPAVLLGHGNAIAEGATFGLLGSAIRGAVAIREDDPPAERRKKIARLLGPAPEERVELALLHLISANADATAVAVGALTPDRLRAAFDAWLREYTAKRPVAIVLEDVHWADPPSVSLVDGALRNLWDRPLFVLALARPEVSARFPRLFEARDPRRIALPKLTRQASEALVRSGVGAAIPGPMVERILTRADGNAFYLEELVRAVAAAPVSASDATLELPDTVLGTVQARLDALGEDAKRIIKAASIFGDDATAGGIAAILDTEDLDGVGRALAALAADEVLEERSRGGETTFAFHHALLRDGAYELFVDEQRRTAHERAAAWLLSCGAAERNALVVARHLELGGALPDAAPHYERAAAHALQAGDFLLAVESAEKALRGGATGEPAGKLLVLAAEAQRWLGDLAAALDAASRAVPFLPPGSRAWFGAMREIIDAHGRLGNLASIEPLVERVLAEEPRADAVGMKITALTLAATNLLYNGDIARGAAILPRVNLLSRARDLTAAEQARVHELRATHAALTDQLQRARDEYALALEWLDPAGEERRAVIVRSNLGFIELQLGDVDRGEHTLRAAIAVAARLGVETTRALLLQNLGIALRLQGRAEESLAVQTEALDLFVAHKDPRLAGWSRLHLAVLALDRGDLGAALDHANAVLAAGGDMQAIAAHALVARALLRLGAVESSLSSAELGVAAIERVGCVEDFDVLAWVVLAECLLASGERDRARDVLRVARGRLELRLEGIPDDTLKASFVTRVPDNARAFALFSELDVGPAGPPSSPP